MKITARPDLRASLKRRRMRAAPRPTNISTKLEPEAEKKSTPACAATARASIVLPVPGGPKSSTPRGGWAPSAAKRSGSRSHSATSISSSLAASTPCTSSQSTGSVLLAFTVSGLVVPIVLRISLRKTNSSPAMKTTPKTGYQLKKKAWISDAWSAWIRCMSPACGIDWRSAIVWAKSPRPNRTSVQKEPVA